jgi:hypothetical protein
MLDISFAMLTTLHVVISLVGILAGSLVVAGLLCGKRVEAWTEIFLATTVLTSVTGFMFPISGLTPGLVVGAISLAVLAIALVALYGFELAGAWRWIYVVTAMAALYLNVFVGVVQAFAKVAFLRALAPTQSEPPFVAAQVAVLILFLIAGYLAVVRFTPETGFTRTVPRL